MTREEAIKIVKEFINGTCLHLVDQEALETLIPELAESEDERIRKEIISALKFANDGGVYDKHIAYLEKQKEQKPAESISQLTVQGKGVYKICPRCKERMVRDDSKVYTSMPPQYGYECPKCGEMEFDTVMYDNPEMEEQKPVVTHGETYHVDTLGTQQVIAGKMPQKSVEWSDTDNIGWDEAFACATRAEKSAKNEEELQNAVIAEKWLKEIKFKYCVHPVKQEWSVEDEDRIRQIERIAQQAGCTQKLQEEIHDWLKSLRPQPMNTIKIDELEDFIDTELHKDEFIRRWPQYAFNVPEHKEGDEYSVGVAVGVGRVINKLRNFIVNKKA